MSPETSVYSFSLKRFFRLALLLCSKRLIKSVYSSSLWYFVLSCEKKFYYCCDLQRHVHVLSLYSVLWAGLVIYVGNVCASKELWFCSNPGKGFVCWEVDTVATLQSFDQYLQLKTMCTKRWKWLGLWRLHWRFQESDAETPARMWGCWEGPLLS